MALLHTGVQLNLVPLCSLGTTAEIELQREQLGWKILLTATAEAQRASPAAQTHFKLLACVTVAAIPLAEANHMAEPKSKDCPLVSHMEKANNISAMKMAIPFMKVGMG